jgi:hypothetical protein
MGNVTNIKTGETVEVQQKPGITNSIKVNDYVDMVTPNQ